MNAFDIVELDAGVCTWMSGKEMQEDRFLFDQRLEGPQGEPIVGYAVFDGHSGSLCAEYVVEKLFWYVQNGLTKKKSEKLTEELFKKVVTEAFHSADDEFLEKAKSNLDMDGTTAVVCFLWKDCYYAGCAGGPNMTSDTSTASAHNLKSDPFRASDLRLLVANVGDSRAVMCQKRDRILSESCVNVVVTGPC